MQAQARAAIQRIQEQTEQTKEVATMTLEELRDQRRQSELIELQAQSIEEKLNHSLSLQNSFDRWSLNLRGKAQAKKEAKVVLAAAKAKSSEKSSSTSMDPAITAITNTVTAPRHPVEQKKEVLIESTCKNSVDRNPLDEDDTAGLDRINQTDKELDRFLDQIDASLDGITNLSLAMKEEAHSQHERLKSVSQTMERANEKQAVALSRVRRSLTGRWLRPSQQSKK